MATPKMREIINTGNTGNNLFRQLGVDQIILTNLDCQPHKLASVKMKLASLGVDRFILNVGVYGKESPACQQYFKRGYRAINSIGAVGILFSYRNLLNELKLEPAKRYLFLEDDVCFHGDIEKLSRQWSGKLSGYEIVYLGANPYGLADVNRYKQPGLYVLGASDTIMGAYGYIITGNQLLKMKQELVEPKVPVDHILNGLSKQCRSCVVNPNLILPNVSTSLNMGPRSQEAFTQRIHQRLSDYRMVNDELFKIPTPPHMSTLHHYVGNPPTDRNYGDAVGPDFVRRLTGTEATVVSTSQPHCLAVGSILHFATQNSVVWGSGAITEQSIKAPGRILSVRGPLTRRALLNRKISCPEVYGDPLILISLVYSSAKKPVYDVGLIPHYVDRNEPKFQALLKKLESQGLQVKVIDVLTGDRPQQLIDDIHQCRKIVSSSLHGIIVPLSYGIPTVFMEFSTKVIGNRFKFNDFFASLGISYTPSDERNVIKIDPTALLNLGIGTLLSCPFFPNRQAALKRVHEWYDSFYSVN